MIKYVNQDPKFTSGKHPCGVCCKGVGFNSIFCNNCAHWVHKQWKQTEWQFGQCLDNMEDSFKCTICQKPPVTNGEDKNVELDNADYDVTDQFCYFGDIVRAVWHAKAIKIYCEVTVTGLEPRTT